MKRRTFVKWSALSSLAATGNLPAQAAAPQLHTLSSLPYAPNTLEPHIDAQTITIHHGKHHAAYVTKLNEALISLPSLQKSSLAELMPQVAKIEKLDLQTAVRNNGGGHWNHSFFWNTMAPADQKSTPSEALDKALQDSFSTVAQFKTLFAEAAMKRFGSGWAWLILRNGKLAITTTANQDNPLMRGIVAEAELGKPLLAIDLWEHAYYLHYQNRRADYVQAWWNLVNWNEVNTRLVS